MIARAQDRIAQQDSIKHKLAATLPDTTRVSLLNQLSNNYRQINIDSALHYALLADTLAQKTGNKRGKAEADVLIGIYYRNKGDYPTALLYLQESIRLFEATRTTALLADAYLEVAQVYKDMTGATNTPDYIHKGITYSRQAYDLFQSVHDIDGMINSLNMVGIISRDKAKAYGGQRSYYDTAFTAYTQAIQFMEQSGQGKQYTGKLYNNISQVYSEYRNDYAKALDYLFRAVDFNKKNNNISSLSFNYGNISHAYVKLNKPQQALFYARETLHTASLLNRPERMRNAYSQMYEAFRAAGQMDSALQYYTLADRVDDSLTNLAKTQQVMDLQTKYETAKKETQIQQLQTEGSTKNKRIAYLIAGLAVLVVLTGSLLWLYQRIKKQRQLIAAQSKGLEVMMKELHHRVKNNLQIVSSLLSLQTNRVQDEGAASILKESQQRVQAMSFIHQRLYKKEELTSVNMKEYLTDLAESLVASYGYHPDEFDLRVSVEQEMMDIDKALPIGLIMNEIITNALKYAYKDISHPSLHIQLAQHTDHITCSVKDNGIGINETEWKQKSSSFGKQLITALCKQLRARQALVVDQGTQFTISIPVQAA
jgi:two-component sensor histidine kinase